jgi:vitamin B12 transporter
MLLPAQTSEFQLENFSEEMIVVSSRIETPLRTVGTAVSVITAKDIQLQGYNSMAEVLRTQPGIGITNNGGPGKPTNVRIRGEEGYRTLVMIDGVKLADPSGTQVAPMFEHLISTNKIERIEILRGTQGFIYGADAGGVVNILTRTGAGPVEGEVNIGFGRFNTQKLDGTFSGGNNERDFFISVSDLSSDGYNSKTSDTDLMDDDGYENTTLHAKLGWEPTDNFRLQLVMRNTDAENKFDSCGFPTTNDCTGSISQALFKLSGNYEADKFTHFLSVSATDVQRSNLWAGVKSFMTEGNIRHAEYIGSVKLNTISTLVYGADLNKEYVVSNSGNNLERNQTGSYLEYQSRVRKNSFLTAGARYDDSDDFGKHMSIRISAAQFKNLDDGSTLKYRTSYGTGFRAPSLSEMAFNIGPLAFPPATDSPVTEESSAGFDVGIEYTSAGGLHVGATYFNQKIEDEIFFDLAGFSGYLQSFGTNLSRGVEVIVEYPITPQWTVLGNLTTNDTKNQEGLRRIRRPRQLTNIGIRFSSPNNRFRLRAHYRTSKGSIDQLYGIGRVLLNDYQILDISTVYALSETLETYGRLENVTDEDYQEVIGFRSAGFAAYGGIRIRFR